MRLTFKRRPRGDILIHTLLFVLIIITLVSTMSGLMFSQVSWSNHSVNQLRAKLAARAAIQIAIAEIKADQSFTEDILWERDNVVETALLTWNPDSGVPYSTNNTRSGVAKPCWDGPEPLSDGKVIPNAVHLVAVGTCRNARYVAEAEVLLPPYPYALASTGEIVSNGVLEISGVKSLAEADITPDDKKLEGHIVSNSRAGNSISLSGDVSISGDVRSTGGVSVNPANVKGDVLDNEEKPADLPKMGLNRPSGSNPADDKTLYISDFDFTKNSSLAADADRNLEVSLADAQATPGTFEVSELRVRVDARSAPLELNSGVQLNDGALFVDGDVIIRGGVKGFGGIVATGKITIHGPSALASDQVALISAGGVEINGQGLGISKFRGLVATMGDFKADSSQIYGAFIGTGTDPATNLGTSKMNLRDVVTTHAPDATSMDVTIHVELKEMLNVGAGATYSGNSQIGLLHEGTFYTFTGDPALPDDQRQAQVNASYAELRGIQGEEHPMATGSVVIRKADGTLVDEGDLSFAQRSARENFRTNWSDYLTHLERSEVVEYTIFEIDLNKFTSGSSRIKVLTYR